MNTASGTLRMRFTSEDLLALRIRAAPDPMWELALSVHKLKPVPHKAGGCADQVREAHRLIAGLIPRRGNFADFLTPTRGSESLREGLDAIASLPRDRLSEDLDPRRLGRPADSYTRGLARGDPEARGTLLCSLERYFRAMIEPRWSLIRRMTVTNNGAARRLAEAGVGAMIESLCPTIRWQWPWLEADYPFDREIDLGGRGLTLLPSFFCDDVPVTLIDPQLAPVLVFPVRGMPGVPIDPDRTLARLAPVMGETRVAILIQLAHPSTTSDLAAAVDLSLATVSQQVSLLRDAGFVTSVRDGRSVVHALSGYGRSVLAE